MNREDILTIVKHYGIDSFEEAREIDSTNGDVDEKQENLDTLVAELKKYGEDALAEEVTAFNEFNRAQLKKIYKKLPRCVIQGEQVG